MPSADFLRELRLQYDRIHQIKDSLRTKANNTIMMSGTITPLLIGFGIFLLRDIEPQNFVFLIFAILALMAEIILTTIIIRYSLNAYRAREYYYPISYEPFYDNENLREDVIQLFIDSNDEEFNRLYINEYLTGIRQNQRTLTDISNKIDVAQKYFLALVGTIPFFVLMLILAKFIT